MDGIRRKFLASAGAGVAGIGGFALLGPRAVLGSDKLPAAFEVTHTEDEWRRLLTPQQYAVLREGGTERPFSSSLNNEHRDGIFSCAGCKLDLYSSNTKFDSGTGWPSFWQPLDNAVLEHTDRSFGMSRTAVSCKRCGGHLGHVFDDGPRPTGLRYCMDGVAMTFRPDGQPSNRG